MRKLIVHSSRTEVSKILVTDDWKRSLKSALHKQNFAVISDKRLQIGIPNARISIRLGAGERVKSMSVAEEVARKLALAGIDRKSLLVAVGGGSITDLAGFVASIYMRGIRYINVPTTLLAMADAAIGGKTGVNSAMAKNAIGAFHLPEKVIIDTRLLKTLPHRQLLNGFGEVLKCAVIMGGELRDLSTAGVPSGGGLKRAVYLSAKCKVDIVNEDPFESSLRAVLNLGHTVGHAVEAAAGFTIPHGCAVAFGLIIEARMGEALGITRKGFADEFERAVRTAGFRTEYDAARSMELLVHDKKKVGDKIVLALPRDWGRIEYPVVLPITGFIRLCRSATGY